MNPISPSLWCPLFAIEVKSFVEDRGGAGGPSRFGMFDDPITLSFVARGIRSGDRIRSCADESGHVGLPYEVLRPEPSGEPRRFSTSSIHQIDFFEGHFESLHPPTRMELRALLVRSGSLMLQVAHLNAK